MLETKTKEEIIDWLDKYKIKRYKINEDLTVDVDGSVNLEFKYFKIISINFNIVKGNFSCAHNELTSLSGCPKVVGREFNCGFNNLKNLIGSPKIVHGNFNCSNNKLITLLSDSEVITGSFWCENNMLENLNGLPKEIKSRVVFNNNPKLGELQSFNFNDLKKYINKIELDKLLSNKKITSKVKI